MTEPGLARGLAMEQVRAQEKVLVRALELGLGLVQAERAPALARVSGQALEPELDWALASDWVLVLESAQVPDSGRALVSARGWPNRPHRHRRSTPMRNSPSEGGLSAMPQAALPRWPSCVLPEN